MKVVIGTPINRKSCYALEKFLENQKQIQQSYADCELIFSTSDISYVDELKNHLIQWDLRGRVLAHKEVKPDYAKTRAWDIASGRDTIRQYFLSQPEAEKLLFLDSDMTFDPQVVSILEKELENCGAVFSGYRDKNTMVCLLGAGCFMLSRKSLERIKFRCYEFKNGQLFYDDTMAEMDLFRHGFRIKKGMFLSIDHYISPSEALPFSPQKMGYHKITTNSWLRFCLIRTGIAIHYNIPSKGQHILLDLRNFFDKLRGRLFRVARD
jgi:hypothetical protein